MWTVVAARPGYAAHVADRRREEDADAGRADEVDQDAEPTLTAPVEDRPGAGASTARADSPDVVDTDDSDVEEPQP